eukprot:gnl/TRDRNA2_/TRDRNA2_60582_c0_seq1.p1 gnl/TRDRNA2_/TRDRNA2_60582_c0~~gnl/TRDRNA2_/TRDRNA2_60582_c0_seq1.p1  ORF type:complete len:363 (+),score=50.55 gnl/TRDRNA2_/TRDRNA2_60582_c0_seq1:84-1172(+)
MVVNEPLVTTAFIKLLQSYEGRDRIARAFQYAAKLVVGCTKNSSSPGVQEVRSFAARACVSLSGSRRTFRWGKEVPVALQFARCLTEPMDPATRILEISQMASLLAFLLLDHIGSLMQVRFGLKGGAKTIRLSLGCLTVSCLLSMASSTKTFASLSPAPYSQQENREVAEKRRTHAVMILRNGLMALQTAHLSALFTTHDIFVGLIGILTSLIDIGKIWPEWRVLLTLSPMTKLLPGGKWLLRQLQSKAAEGAFAEPHGRISIWRPFWGAEYMLQTMLLDRTRATSASSSEPGSCRKLPGVCEVVQSLNELKQVESLTEIDKKMLEQQVDKKMVEVTMTSSTLSVFTGSGDEELLTISDDEW